MRSEYKTILPVLAIFHFPIVFLYSYMINRADFLSLMLDSADGTAVLKNLLLLYAGSMLSTVFDTYIKNLISGALIFAAWRKTAFGEKASMRDMLRAGGRLLLYMWLLSILVQAVMGVFGGVMFAGMMMISGVGALMAANPLTEALYGTGIFLLVLAVACAVIYFVARLSLIPQAVVIDRINVFQAFKYSWKATKRQVRHIIALFLAAILTTLMVNTTISVLNTVNLFNGQIFVAILSALVSALGSLGTYLWSLSASFFYMRRRVELAGENEFELRLNEFFGKRGV